MIFTRSQFRASANDVSKFSLEAVTAAPISIDTVKICMALLYKNQEIFLDLENLGFGFSLQPSNFILITKYISSLLLLAPVRSPSSSWLLSTAVGGAVT